MAMSFSRVQGMLFLLLLPCLCSGQPAAPLPRFSTFLDPPNRVHLLWDHDEQELMTSELQIRATGWVAFAFSPRGGLPECDIVIGGAFPKGIFYFSVS
ncbi:MOXD2 protein, partial [Tyrannus savana]|nr:MOXD2 protein [Tyrannus savana]